VQLIIPMSGMGTRFAEKGYALPKPLITISGKPMIQHVVEMFPGVEETLFIVNKDHFNDPALNLETTLNAIYPGCKIAVIESHKLGPAWAIQMAKEFVNLSLPVVVNYCDFACLWDFKSFRNELESGIDGLIATYSGFHPHMLSSTQYAYLKLDANRNLTDIREKTSFTNHPSREPASSGTYGFKSGKILMDAIAEQIQQEHSYNNEYYSSLTYINMIKSGMKIKNFEIEKFFQWGTPSDFEEFKRQKDFFQFRKTSKSFDLPIDRIELLAAGAGQRFMTAGYEVIKPLLPLEDSFLADAALSAFNAHSAEKGILLQRDTIVPDEFLESIKSKNVVVTRVTGLTRGQADSAFIAMGRMTQGNCVIAPCDSLLFPKNDQQLNKIRGKTLGVWVTSPSLYALKNPQQFGWVAVGSNSEITGSWIKTEPISGKNRKVITGSFIFGDSREGALLLEKFLNSNQTISGEFYLDSVLSFASKYGWEVVALEPDWFISLGTPDEYETYTYWEELFAVRTDLLVPDED
jgi:dTDP-glucose pyrophosphorylase